MNKGSYSEAAVERCVAYLHGLSQLTGYPSNTSDMIILCTFLQFIPIYNNYMLVTAQLMV